MHAVCHEVQVQKGDLAALRELAVGQGLKIAHLGSGRIEIVASGPSLIQDLLAKFHRRTGRKLSSHPAKLGGGQI